MKGTRSRLAACGVSVLGLLLACSAEVALAAGAAPLLVAVSEPDIEAIVKDVGGNQVETFVLFRGCILRRDLQVEPAAVAKLLAAKAIVWTGFLPEAGAIRGAIADGRNSPARDSWGPAWIDVSKHATQVDAPVSTCQGYVDLITTRGDPFFRLNPENGVVMARDVADGLARLRPSARAYFEANARAFQVSLERDIARWKEELKSLARLRVFSTQCGWQNLARFGGPQFVVCKKAPGSAFAIEALVQHVQQMKAELILLDPHTPPDLAKALREIGGVAVVEAPSSIGDLPGAMGYSAIFDNLIQVLQRVATENSGKE